MKMPKKRKALIIVENLPVPLDRRVWQEAQSLKAAGYGVTVLCPRMKGYVKGYECIDGIHVYRHPMPKEARGAVQYLVEYSAALFWEFLYSFHIFMRRGFDLIQACNPPDLIFLVAALYKVMAGRKFIFDHHDGNPEIWVAKGGRKGDPFYRALSFFERRSFRWADAVMTVNEPYRRIAIRRGGVAPERTFVVRNSPKVPRFDPADYPAAGDGKAVVGYLGVMGKQDGVENLLACIEHIVKGKGRRDIVLKLMGTGPELARIKELTARAGLADRVIFTGWISGEDYIRHMNSCDVCVNADDVSEYNNYCSPNKVYEYMFFSKPIVQFRMDENGFQAEGACLFAKPNDYRDMAERILELVDDPALRRRLGEAGKKRFHEMFTWERSERELLDAYASVLGRPRSG
jgi:glycosyltransferase involved in cell wall biosynthesis